MTLRSAKVNQEFLRQLAAVAETAAKAGGKELRRWRGQFKTHMKGHRDLVTDADLASQKAIRLIIATHFPDHTFVGEEREQPPETADDGQVKWIVDPLDGTTNYVHGYPYYAVSVGVACGNQLLAGVIYDPVRDQCFSATLGNGAQCNGDELRTSAVTEVSQALAGVSLPADVQRNSLDLRDFVEAALVCQAVRRMGSAALNLAHVASGALDAFWATQINPWDVAAGVLIVREAGGVVTGRNGKEFDLQKPHFIAAATIQLQSNLLDLLAPFTES